MNPISKLKNAYFCFKHIKVGLCKKPFQLVFHFLQAWRCRLWICTHRCPVAAWNPVSPRWTKLSPLASEAGALLRGLRCGFPEILFFFGETCDKPGGFCFSPQNQINSDLLTKSFFRGCQKGTTVKLKLLNHSMAKIQRKGTWGLASKA